MSVPFKFLEGCGVEEGFILLPWAQRAATRTGTNGCLLNEHRVWLSMRKSILMVNMPNSGDDCQRIRWGLNHSEPLLGRGMGAGNPALARGGVQNLLTNCDFYSAPQ